MTLANTIQDIKSIMVNMQDNIDEIRYVMFMEEVDKIDEAEYQEKLLADKPTELPVEFID